MIEARIILPRAKSPAEYPAADWLRKELIHLAGGYTELPGMGAWKEPRTAQVYREPVVVFDVAVDERNLETTHRLIGIARELCDRAKQSCVYLRLPWGQVLFVEPGQAFPVTREEDDIERRLPPFDGVEATQEDEGRQGRPGGAVYDRQQAGNEDYGPRSTGLDVVG